MTPFSNESLLREDAGFFRELFENGALTVAALLDRVIEQVENENTNGLALRALISTAPVGKLRERADLLDQELCSGRARGPLHGIPVVIKDCIATGPELEMMTSAGSCALLEGKTIKNAPLVDRLLEAGAIIIGKANLTEFCAFKGDGLIDGFSPVGGQTVSPFVYSEIKLDEGDLSPTSPGGSSTGSAVSVSAGFALIGIGTENDGSVVQPSSRQALYSLKPTRGLVTGEGCWRVSKNLDTPGAMARSTRDLAAATEILLEPFVREALPPGGYGPFLTGSFKGLTIGFVDPSEWRFPPDLWVPSEEAKEQQDSAYHDTRALIESLGAKTVYPVTLPKAPGALEHKGDYAPFIVNSFDISDATKEYFANYVDAQSTILDLDGVVAFNKEHPDRCLPKDAPDQSLLIQAVKERPSRERYDAAFQHMLKVGRDEGLAKTIREHKLDVVAAPMDSPVCSLSTASGYPIANVPLGRYRLKGELSRPFGLAALATSGREGILFQFMSACEVHLPARAIPERLLQPDKRPSPGPERAIP